MTWPDTPGGQGQPGVFKYFNGNVCIIMSNFLKCFVFLGFFTGRYLTRLNMYTFHAISTSELTWWGHEVQECIEEIKTLSIQVGPSLLSKWREIVCFFCCCSGFHYNYPNWIIGKWCVGSFCSRRLQLVLGNLESLRQRLSALSLWRKQSFCVFLW